MHARTVSIFAKKERLEAVADLDQACTTGSRFYFGGGLFTYFVELFLNLFLCRAWVGAPRDPHLASRNVCLDFYNDGRGKEVHCAGLWQVERYL